MKNEIVIYQDEELTSSIEVRILEETVWLNRHQLSLLFDRDIKTIGKHISNVLKEELKDLPVVAKFATTAADGKTYNVEHYSLDMIISIGYRVKSKRGILFRIWANKVLKDYLLKGYTVNNRIDRIEDDIQKYNEQYEEIVISSYKKSHDRFLIIDSEKVYHIGASLKDLGKKWFAFSKIDLNAEELLDRLEKK
jgi:hypothetical protein